MRNEIEKQINQENGKTHKKNNKKIKTRLDKKL